MKKISTNKLIFGVMLLTMVLAGTFTVSAQSLKWFSPSDPNVSYTYPSQGSATNYGGSSYTGTSCGQGTSLCSIINIVIGFIDQGIVLLIGVSVIVFMYYVFKYFIKPNENHNEAGVYVMYSLIGFFVMLSLWGLVHILQGTFRLGDNNAPSASEIKQLFPR